MRHWLYPALLILAAFVSFSPALLAGFVYDDHFEIEGNPYIKDFSHIKILLTKETWYFSPGTNSNNYRPVHMLSYLLIHSLFGLSPLAFHMTHLLLNVGCVLLLWRILLKFVDDFRAFIGSLLFAVHPVHVEPVVWIGGTADLLLGLFVFLSFLFYLRGNLFASLFAFAFALWSKEPAVLFPAIIVFNYLLFRRHSFRFTSTWLAASGVLAGLYMVTRMYAMDTLLRANQANIGFLQKCFKAAAWPGLYISKLIAPITLNAYYFYTLNAKLIIFSLSILLLTLLLAIIFRKNKAFLFGILWFFVFIFPALMVSAVSPVGFAERYLYVPSAGLAIAIVSFRIKPIVTKALIAACVVMGLVCFLRSPVWHDDLTLWADTIQKSPEAPVVNYNLATAYLKQKNYVTAAKYYQRVVTLDPTAKVEAYYNLALCNHNLGNDQEAIRNLQLFLKHWKGDERKKSEALMRLQQLEQK
jgi:tetratricopeptide (TPR) repeat protein